MAGLYGFSPAAFLFIKIALPVLLVAMIGKVRSSATVRFLLAAALCAYSSVLLLHAVWIVSM